MSFRGKMLGNAAGFLFAANFAVGISQGMKTQRLLNEGINPEAEPTVVVQFLEGNGMVDTGDLNVAWLLVKGTLPGAALGKIFIEWCHGKDSATLKMQAQQPGSVQSLSYSITGALQFGPNN